MWKKLQRFLSCDIGIDLGTANTLVFVKDHGIVINEPSVVAIRDRTKQVLAVGEEAKRMLGRTPGDILAIRPMKSGVIADFEITEAMIRHFINSANVRKLRRPRVVVAVPSDITAVERRAVKDSALAAGAREVFLIEEPMAAAIGSGLPVTEPTASMIVDIGGGTTEVALISLSGIVFSRSERVGGDDLDEAIISYMRRIHHMIIGEIKAEEIKMKLGSACPMGQDFDSKKMEVPGRDSVHGLPKTIEISTDDVRNALREPVSRIVEAVCTCLEKCPPELAGDLVSKGMVLAGGGALLKGLDKLLGNKTGLPVIISEDPLQAVAKGTGMALEELEIMSGGKSR